MKTLLLLTTTLLSIYLTSSAQTVYVDLLTSPAMIVYANQMEDQQKETNTNLSNIQKTQLLIRTQLNAANEIQKKIQKGLSEVSQTVTNAITVKRIYECSQDVLVVNRLVRLINSKGNLPTAIIADEVPTLYIHKVENLIATARSNRVAVILGLQELPQFKQQYGRETADTISAVIGNVLSGSVRHKETLDWLERLFGKVKQTGESLTIDRHRTSIGMNEKLESLIPAGKIALLKTGEMVGLIARDADERKPYTGQYISSAIHCKINLDMDAIRREEAGYKELPVFYDFQGRQDQILFANYQHITDEIEELVATIVSG